MSKIENCQSFLMTGIICNDWSRRLCFKSLNASPQRSRETSLLLSTCEAGASCKAWGARAPRHANHDGSPRQRAAALCNATVTVRDDNVGQVASKVSKTYHMFPWGENLIQTVIDPDGAALKTAYAFYEDPAEVGRYTRPKSVINPDGSWEKYDYDSAGNQVLVLRPWKDLSFGAATESNSHATRYTYSNFDGINLSLYAKHVSSMTETVAGTVVRKTSYTRTGTTVSGNPAVVERATVYSSATDVLVTTTTRYHSSAQPSLTGRVISVEHPDGRRDTYSYEMGNYTPNADPALSLFTPDVNGQSERETVVHGTTASPDGVAFKTTKETTIRDQYGNQALQETFVYNGTGYERVGWTASTYDDRGHLVQTMRHTGQVSTAVWQGDRKMSEIDESGMETVYSYDVLERIKTTTKKGVAAVGGFPAQPDITTTITYDAEGRSLGEVVTAGGLSLSKSSAYDAAGRLKSSTDQSGLVTTYQYANGGRSETVTAPGGATQIIDRYLDGQTKSVTGTAAVAQYFDYGVDFTTSTDGAQFTRAFVGSNGLASPRWTKTTTDWLGRTIRVERPAFTGTSLVKTSAYDNKGQLQSEATMAGTSKVMADRLYEYDELGNRIRVGSDVDANGTLTSASIDRINESETVYEKVGSDWFKVTSGKTYLANNDATPTVQTERERLNNFPVSGTEQTVSDITITDVAGNNTRITSAVDRTVKKATTVTDTPDSNINAVSISVNGLLQSTTPSTPQAATTYAYDALGRQTSTTDPRAGTTTTVYDPATGRLIATARLTSTGDAVGTISYEYYPATHTNAGRVRAQTNAAGKKVYFSYSGRGELVQTWGDATYPVEYVYDAYGQKAELHTFRGGQNWGASEWPAQTTGAVDVTRWVYQDATGLLTQKQDATSKGASFTYDELGRLKTRVWARGVGCTYSYDPQTGEFSGVDYSDSTLDVTFNYDRGGRQVNVTDAAGEHTRSFNVAGELQTEQIAGGILDMVQVSATYDGFLRRQFLQTSRGGNVLKSQTYTYDVTSRLETITSGAQTATYAYYPGSGLLNTTTFTGGTNISRSYDSLGRLQTITTSPAADAAQSYTYTYNELHQRTLVTREDGSYWSYAYNDRGELIFGKKYWADNSFVSGNQSEYDYDTIGNRKSAKAGGNEVGNLRQSTYTANALNQYVQRTVPGAVDVMGTANAAATVSVNNQTAARKGDYFYKELAVDNNAAPAYAQINVVGARTNFGAGGEDAVTEKGGSVYVPQGVEAFTYDEDGNMTSDGRWQYTWDGENRLISMEAVASVPVEAKRKLEFEYDYMGRRIAKKMWVWGAETASYQLQSVTKFVYDGWNLVAELDSSNQLLRSYVWGQDVNGSLQGAGGIGGLLLINEGGQTSQAAHDGNGNVGVLVKASTGATSAVYDYDPFGNVIRATGEYAAKNAFKFSTKYTDLETELLYYGYRYYNSHTGRWISRDPSEETGGVNLYGMVGNNPVSFFDPLGLQAKSSRRGTKQPKKCESCCAEDLGSGGLAKSPVNLDKLKNALTSCIREFFTDKISLVDFSPTGKGQDGRFSGKDSWGTSFDIVNDSHSYSRAGLLRLNVQALGPQVLLEGNRRVGVTYSGEPYSDPITGIEMPAPGNPWWNFTASDRDKGRTEQQDFTPCINPFVLTQVHELGNSLSFITGIKRSTPTRTDQDTGAAFEECTFNKYYGRN
jgi:RHS repeat-associated protein